MPSPVRLDNSALIALLQDPRYAAAISCLAVLRQQFVDAQHSGTVATTGCGRCTKRAAQVASSYNVDTAVQQIKQCLATSGSAERNTLKALLNVGDAKIRLTYRSGDKVITKDI